jgi:glycolate oxidase FAD binding subunit
MAHDALSTLTIDGFGPVPVVRPGSVAELGDLVRRCAAEGQALYPLGGRTRLDLGRPPRRAGVAADLRGLDRVIDYPARDMTITVEAGITLARLQDVLAAENQRLPIDVPRPDEATLGGAIATNTSGPRRYGFGTLRDYVIGITVVNDEGREVKAGGRVVKNVAGYDLMKLYIGSLGTLGVITQVTLKLKPKPEASILRLIECAPPEAGELLDQLHRSRTRPVCIDLVYIPPAPAGAEEPFNVFVGFEEKAEAVEWQVRQLQDELAGKPWRFSDPAVIGAPYTVDWETLAGTTLQDRAILSVKASVRPSRVASLCQQIGLFPERPLVHAHAGNGIVRAHFFGDLTLGRAAEIVTIVQDSAGADGFVVVERAPSEWKATLPVWGRPPADVALMRAVREALDPRRIFNPDRYLDAL